MRKGGSQKKGATFERYCCRELSKWVTRGKREDIFWRTAMSGGRASIAFKSGTILSAQAGDISAIDPAGMKFVDNFLVDSKHFKNLDIDALIKRRGNLVNFWLALCRDAEKFDKIPFLIARQNNFPILVLSTKKGFHLLGIFRIEAIYPQLNLQVIFWDDFLKCRPLRDRVRL